MSARLLIIILVLMLALAGCDSASAPETANTPPPAAGADATPTDPAPADQPATEPEQPATEPDQPELSAQAGQPAPPAEVLVVVATVNGKPIDGQMLESQVAMAEGDRLMFGQMDELSDEEQAEAQLLRRLEMLSNLISLELACQEALRLGYAPKDAEVDEAMTELKAAYAKPEEFQELLEQYGSTEADLREQLIRTLALQKWQENNFLAQIKVSDEEARAFYDQHQESLRHGDLVRISQIFLPIPLVGTPAQIEKAKAAALSKGQGALKRIRQGEDFGKVAAELSGAPGAAENRGDMGWMEKGQSLPVSEPTIFEMEPGQVSELLESPMGYFLFQLTETRAAGLEPFESVRPDIVDYLSGEKMEGVLRNKMIELYQKADIQILDPKLKDIYEGLPMADLAAPAGEKADETAAPAEEKAAGPAENPPSPELK